MRLPRSLRLLGASLSLASVAATPTWGLAHGLAHHHDDHEAQHVTSLDSHDGPKEISAPDHESGHRHLRVDLPTRPSAPDIVAAPAVARATSLPLDLAPTERVVVVPALSTSSPDPPGNDPPTLRAPPRR